MSMHIFVSSVITMNLCFSKNINTFTIDMVNARMCLLTRWKESYTDKQTDIFL